MKKMAVVVTYNPDEEVYKNIIKLKKQIEHILVVDNSSISNQFKLRENGIKVIYNNKNEGIAKPLNMGIQEASDEGFDWLFTFDQDSVVTENFVNNMLETAKEFQDKEGRFPILISPTYKHPTNGIEYDTAKVSNHSYSMIETAMTSGNLLHVNQLVKANVNFRGDFFIDFVDHEFCFHLRKLGYPIIQSFKATLVHSLGEVTERVIFGKKLSSTNHNPIRRYYITRNRLIVYKKYFGTQKKWIKIDFVNSIMEIIKIILIEDQKIFKMLNIIRGTKDACLKRMGPYRYTKKKLRD